MSREERLFDAIGGADESLLKRSERKRGRVTRLEWAVGLAACLAVVIAAYTLLPGTAGDPPGPSARVEEPDTQQPPPAPENPGGAADQPKVLWPAEEGEMHYLQVLTPSKEPEAQFRIYINREIYYSYEQEGTYIIRPRKESDIAPFCTLVISHIPDATVDEALEQVRESMTGLYEQIESLPGPPNGWFQVKDTERYLFASDGIEWDDVQREVWIQPDGEGGAFVLSSGYYMEATEGHGARFADMMGTFLPEGVYGQTSVWLAELRDVGEQLMEAVFSHDLSGVQDLLAPGAEVNGYVEDVSSWVSVASIDCSYVPADPSEETLTGRVSVRHNASMTEEDYAYLIMELKKTGDQWTATRIGLES